MKICLRKQNVLTHARLREALHYDKATGIFTWKINASTRARIGQVAGSIQPNGYVFVALDHERYLAHRLAWFWVKGEWPDTNIDHRDLLRSNNRWKNLREASYTQNNHNTSIRKSNTSGVTGVHWHSRHKRWIAHIRVNGKKVSLGSFKEKSDAAIAYRIAANKHYGEYACAA